MQCETFNIHCLFASPSLNLFLKWQSRDCGNVCFSRSSCLGVGIDTILQWLSIAPCRDCSLLLTFGQIWPKESFVGEHNTLNSFELGEFEARNELALQCFTVSAIQCWLLLPTSQNQISILVSHDIFVCSPGLNSPNDAKSSLSCFVSYLPVTWWFSLLKLYMFFSVVSLLCSLPCFTWKGSFLASDSNSSQESV